MNLDGIPAFELEPTGTAAARWATWLARLDNFLLAQNVDGDARRKAILLHCAGEAVFERHQALDTRDGDGTFDQTKDLLSAHFNPARNREFEVFNFRKLGQAAGEGLDAFHARLHKQSQYCEFANVDSEVKSQLIQATTMGRLRDKGLSEPGMRFGEFNECRIK